MAKAGNIVARDFMRQTEFQVAVTKGIVVISTTVDQAIKPTASGQFPLGVVEKSWDQYARGEVITKGKAVCRITGAVSYGAYVSIGDTNGYVKPAHPGEPLVGRAMMAGTTAGDEIEVELMIGQICPSAVGTASAATYDVAYNVDIVKVTRTATGTCQVNLPTVRMLAGQIIYVQDAGGGAGGNNITVATDGAELINGGDTITISTNYDGRTIYSDGSAWYAW